MKKDKEYRAGPVLLAYKMSDKERKAPQKDPSSLALAGTGAGLGIGSMAAYLKPGMNQVKQAKIVLPLAAGSIAASSAGMARIHHVRQEARRSEGKNPRSFWTGEEVKKNAFGVEDSRISKKGLGKTGNAALRRLGGAYGLNKPVPKKAAKAQRKAEDAAQAGTRKPPKEHKFDWSGIGRNKYALGAAGGTAAAGAGALGYMAYSDNKR